MAQKNATLQHKKVTTWRKKCNKLHMAQKNVTLQHKKVTTWRKKMQQTS